MCKLNGPRKDKTILKKKKLETYKSHSSQDSVVLVKDRNGDQQNRIESPERDTEI